MMPTSAEQWPLEFPGSLGGELCRLRDGTLVRIRPVEPSDRTRVVEFLQRLSRESLELRFFSAVTTEVVADEILGGKTWPDRLSLVLETNDHRPPQIIGHAEYDRSPRGGTRAEVAFLIADEHQGQGAGTLLLRQLARWARKAGIRSFDAVVLAENRAMLEMFTGAGFPNITVWEGTEARVELDIARDPRSALVPVIRPPYGEALVV
jgi:acetate---CoA ligase (ADP-forming)